MFFYEGVILVSRSKCDGFDAQLSLPFVNERNPGFGSQSVCFYLSIVLFMILIGWHCVYLIFLSFFLYLSIALSFSSLSCNFNYNSSFIDFHLLSKLLSSSMCVCFGMFLFLTFSFSSLFLFQLYGSPITLVVIKFRNVWIFCIHVF